MNLQFGFFYMSFKFFSFLFLYLVLEFHIQTVHQLVSERRSSFCRCRSSCSCRCSCFLLSLLTWTPAEFGRSGSFCQESCSSPALLLLLLPFDELRVLCMQDATETLLDQRETGHETNLFLPQFLGLWLFLKW